MPPSPQRRVIGVILEERWGLPSLRTGGLHWGREGIDPLSALFVSGRLGLLVGGPFLFHIGAAPGHPPEGHGPSSAPSIASARASTPRQWSLAWRATGRQGRLRQACGHAPPQLAGRRDFHPRPVSVPSSLMNWARWCWVHARRGRSGDCAPHAPDECGAAGSVVAWAVSASAFCRSGSFPSTAAVWQPSCGRILTAPIHSSALSARPPPSGRAPLYRVTNARRVLFAVPT